MSRNEPVLGHVQLLDQLPPSEDWGSPFWVRFHTIAFKQHVGSAFVIRNSVTSLDDGAQTL
jgi:hypothetical protein